MRHAVSGRKSLGNAGMEPWPVATSFGEAMQRWTQNEARYWLWPMLGLEFEGHMNQNTRLKGRLLIMNVGVRSHANH